MLDPMLLIYVIICELTNYIFKILWRTLIKIDFFELLHFWVHSIIVDNEKSINIFNKNQYTILYISYIIIHDT